MIMADRNYTKYMQIYSSATRITKILLYLTAIVMTNQM